MEEDEIIGSETLDEKRTRATLMIINSLVTCRNIARDIGGGCRRCVHILSEDFP